MGTARPDPPQPGPASFGALLRRFRLAAGVSQERLAERAGLSVAGLSALENGRRQAPYRHTVGLLARALALNAEETAALQATIVRGRLPAGADRAGAPSPSTVRLPTTDLPAAQGPAPSPLVGRGRELRLLEGHLAGEGPPLLLLAGEPGIGKSRLLAELAGRAQEQGWQVLAGGCQRRGGQEPYTPLLEAVERHIRRQAPGGRQAVLRGCAWLVKLLPEIAAEPIEALPAWLVPPEHERRLVFKAVQRYLAAVEGSSRRHGSGWRRRWPSSAGWGRGGMWRASRAIWPACTPNQGSDQAERRNGTMSYDLSLGGGSYTKASSSRSIAGSCLRSAQ